MCSHVAYASNSMPTNGLSESMVEGLPSRNTPPCLMAPLGALLAPLVHAAASRMVAAAPSRRGEYRPAAVDRLMKALLIHPRSSPSGPGPLLHEAVNKATNAAATAVLSSVSRGTSLELSSQETSVSSLRGKLVNNYRADSPQKVRDRPYQRAPSGRTQVLDELCALTGWHRDTPSEPAHVRGR